MSGSDGSANSDEDGQERRIILHVYDDESRDFTDLTTYHGMRRIYASATWPSRIFWSLVVVTCLTLFMIHVRTFELLSIVSEGSHRIAYQVLNDIPLHENDLNYLQSQRGLLQDYLNYTRVDCSSLIENVFIGKRRVDNPCHYSEEIITDIGYCVSLTFRDLSAEATDSVEIEISSQGTGSISFQLHPHGSHSNMKSKRRFLRNSYRSIISLKISMEHLLHQNDWGSCHNEFENLHFDGQLYQQTECEKNCVAMQYIDRCSCVPFHLAKEGVKVCSLGEMLFCKEIDRPSQTCDCPLECERLLFEIAEPSFIRMKQIKKSILQLEFSSHKVHTFYQLKRIKATFSGFVAGSMGLFLGMSCVTLLEIFIYLFKSVWGVFNDERHKSYWGNLIGDEEGEKRRQSYEQIVITTKTAKTEVDVPKTVIEENYAVLTDPMTRRTSVIRIGPQYAVSNESRSRSNTGNLDENAPNAGLKIRLMRRQSVTTGRRKSVYNAFGNF